MRYIHVAHARDARATCGCPPRGILPLARTPSSGGSSSSAQPIKKSPKGDFFELARLEGFEPPTNGFGSHYSIRLSYRR